MHDEKLSYVLCETAEQMFFQTFEDSLDFAMPERVYWAKVDVHTPSDFELIVAAEEGEIRNTFQELFTAGEDATDEQVIDLVAELANTIAGSLARHLSESEKLDLSPPHKGLGKVPGADLYHAFRGEELTLYVAVEKARP